MNFLKNDPILKDRRRELRRNQTDAERAFWSQIRNKQFFGMKFFRQYSFGSYILDFYCPEKKLAVELDGGQHNMAKEIDYDRRRDKFIKNSGYRVLRIWNNDVDNNMDGVVEKIYQMLQNGNPHP